MEFASIVYMIFHLLMPNYDAYKAAQNVEKYYEAVALIESNNDGSARNRRSSASSYFQVINKTFKYSKEQAAKMGYVVPSDKKHISDLTYEEQRDLLFVYMYTQKRHRKYMRGIMKGDMKEAMQGYFKHHHTRPDAATIKRAKRIFKEVYQ